MRRPLVFAGCLAAGSLLLVWQAGGLEGPRSNQPDPEVGRAPPAAARGAPPLPIGTVPGTPAISVDAIGPSYYPRTEPRTFREPRTGERVEIPHFVAWTFRARAGAPVSGTEAPEGAIVFEDVEVHTYRDPASLEEARRLRDDPRAIETLARLRVFAPRARADGIATLLRSRGQPAPVARDWTIRLDGGVRIRDLSEEVEMRGRALTFDPEAGRAEGSGPFTVEHAAWTVRGEELTIVRDLRARDVYRVDVGKDVVLDLRAPAKGGEGRARAGTSERFRPTQVYARRASMLHDETGGKRVHVALEGAVRGVQEGGRRLLADRLQLTAEADRERAAAGARSWSLVDLLATGTPVVLEADDVQARRSGPAAGRITARSLRFERSPSGVEAMLLEGEPVLALLGDLALPGMPGRGRWIRASARDRAVMTDVAQVARLEDGSPVAGRRLELHGAARLERRGEGEPPFEDVLEGDEVSLTLRPRLGEEAEQPVAFAARGHVRLSGTRLGGEAERLVVEGLDTVTPSVLADGRGTQLRLLGVAENQRLLAADPEPGAEAAPAEAPPESGDPAVWRLDRLEATGRVAAETRTGGPVLGVPAWIEADRALYERLTERATLFGSGASPASVRVDAGDDRRHALVAPTLTYEGARGVVRAEGGAQGEIHVGGGGAGFRDASALGLRGPRTARRDSTLVLETDGAIELRFRLAKVGGDPAPGLPQVLRVPVPFRAHVEGLTPETQDRMRADRLEAAFVLVAKEPAAQGARVTARAGRAREERPDAEPAPRAAPEPARRERWRLSARTLAFALAGSRLDSLEAEGGVVVEGETLQVEGRVLRFDGRHGVLRLEGAPTRPDGPPRTRARFGRAGAQSTVEAAALRAQIDDEGVRSLAASAPVEALLLDVDPGRGGVATRFEVHCHGDVHITRTELATVGTAETWLRRTERIVGPPERTEVAEVWTQRLVVRGRSLLPGGPPGGGPGVDARHVERVLAEGPNTTFASGEGERRVEMWCERIEIDVPQHTATLSGAPGRDVRLRRGGEIESELLRATFDFRTGAVHDMEAAGIVLRRGR